MYDLDIASEEVDELQESVDKCRKRRKDFVRALGRKYSRSSRPPPFSKRTATDDWDRCENLLESFLSQELDVVRRAVSKFNSRHFIYLVSRQISTLTL